MEAVEVDIANVEWRIHAGAEQSEIDRPDLTLDPDDAGFELVGLKHVGGKGLDVVADCRNRSSSVLGRAVAATLTPDAARRRAISPQIAPDAPVIQAVFQGNWSATFTSCLSCPRRRASSNPCDLR